MGLAYTRSRHTLWAEELYGLVRSGFERSRVWFAGKVINVV